MTVAPTHEPRIAEILAGGDPAKLMQDLNDEANELHREALEDIKG